MKRSNIFILIIVIIIAVVMVSISSYAYFTANVSGDSERVTTVTTGTMSISYIDGSDIDLNNAIPGDTITKNFTITNTGNVNTNYDVYLSDLVNDFNYKTDLVYTLTSSDGGYSTNGDKQIPSLSSKIIENYSLAPNATNTYNLTIKFLNKDEAQDDNQGRIFSAKLQVNTFEDGGFYRVSGTNVIDSLGNVYLMKGMGFGNNVWANPSTPTVNYNDESSYTELASLGFNHIRYYLNTNLLVDKTTGEWNEAGWTWVDQNIAWAKKHGITFTLNLHVPPGGFMSATNVNFWKSQTNLDLFKKIWVEIANRYKDENMIVGYDLLNEPFLPSQTTADEVLDTYYNLINETITAIRKVDSNHIMFIESPYGYFNGSTTTYFGYTDSFRLVNDSNSVYEYHYYYPTNFVYQKIPYMTGSDKGITYPNDSLIATTGSYTMKGISKNASASSYDTSSSEWQYIESPLTLPLTGSNSFYWLMYSHGIIGTANFDDINVKEYDSSGNYIKTIQTFDFTSTTSTSGWDLGTGGGGTVTYDSAIGHNAAGSIKVSNSTNDYRFYMNGRYFYKIDPTHYYTVGAYVKFNNCDANTTITPAFQFTNATAIQTYNKDYLRYMLEIYTNLTNTNNVPLYIGEFGVPRYITGNEYNGEGWVGDLLDLLKEYNVGFAYHDFHNDNWGYYYNSMTTVCSDKNTYLETLFREKLSS